MNLIEISEQLKDVPDQYLMREVQNPTGDYPAYLVISELSRRKRMRESAMKQAPTTTVAEDLAQPPQQPMGRLNAGLGSVPGAAESLAAQDVMAQEEPVRMAGGGVIHAANGLPESMFDEIQYDEMGFPIGQAYPKSEPMSERDAAYIRYKKAQQQAADIYSGKTVLDPRLAESRVGQQGLNLFMKERAPQPNVPVKTTKAPAPVAPRAVVPTPTDKYATQADQVLSGIMALKPPSEQEQAAARAAGRAEYEQQAPYRLGFLEEEIAKRGKDIEGRRSSNINEALMQAGLRIMGSKSPRFLQAVSEGGLSGLDAYRQGVKDIRASEDALLNARTESAKAQMLYDQNKIGAGDKAQQRSSDNFKLAADLANTQNAALVRTGELGLKSAELKQKQPYIEALTQQALANAKFTETGRGKGGISDADQLAADKFANSQLTQLIMKGILPGSPQYIQEYKKQFNWYLNEIRGGAPGVVGGPMPQGWSVQQN